VYGFLGDSCISLSSYFDAKFFLFDGIDVFDVILGFGDASRLEVDLEKFEFDDDILYIKLEYITREKGIFQ